MSKQMRTIAIIGGGAAGLAAAIAAGDRARELGMPVEVVVYERDDRVGRSILATGNGRCNFSNLDLKLYEYHNSDFVKQVFDTAGDEWLVRDFFEGMGLEWRAEPDGRLYPLANKASVVVDVLRAAMADLGVREACDQEVVSIEAPRAEGKPFTLRMKDGAFRRADAVIVACGGRFANSLEVAGLSILPMRPVLGPLAVSKDDVPIVRELDNIRVRCRAILTREKDNEYNAIASEKGELMFRKYGVSGICVFNLSRIAQPGDMLVLNFMPDGFGEFPADYLEGRRKALVERYGEAVTYEQMLRGFLLPRVYEAILKREGKKPSDLCGPKDIEELVGILAFFSLDIAGIGDEGLCQVRRGGFPVDAVAPESMEALGCPGLYLVGEVLDVDGPCGGYNLHWAWTSGILAGKSAVER